MTQSIEYIRCNDILFNIYKDIFITFKKCEEIDNIMTYYLPKIIYIINCNKYKNKTTKISKILEKLYNELKIIYINYNEDYDYEMEKIRRIYLRLDNVRNNENIINNNIDLFKEIQYKLLFSNYLWLI